MARKVKQHRVPQVCLREFCDPSPPTDWPTNQPFTPALWVHPVAFDAPPVRRSPKKVAWDHGAYTLRTDDPNDPWLEEVFTRLENLLGPLFSRLHSGVSLSDTDCALLALFVGAQHERTRGVAAQREAFFGSLAQFSGWLDQADASDAVGALPRELSLRQLPTFMSAFAAVIGPHGRILENSSAYPFITSDHPVYYGQLHADELLAAGFDPRWMSADVPRSARAFFVLCPLTPRHAYVASRFFVPTETIARSPIPHEAMVIVLNDRIRQNAERQVYASSADPFGDYWPALQRMHAMVRTAYAPMANSVRIYTAADRFQIPVSSGLHRDGDHPLHTNYAFTTDALDSLRRVANADMLTEVTVIESGQAMSMMREPRFLSVAIHAEGETVIESGPRF